MNHHLLYPIRSKVLRDLGTAASETEDAVMHRLREKAVLELVQSEKSYLRSVNENVTFYWYKLC